MGDAARVVWRDFSVLFASSPSRFNVANDDCGETKRFGYLQLLKFRFVS